MCYNNCIFERFNPITGDCTCNRGSNQCPEEIKVCENCGEEISFDDMEISLNDTKENHILCETCLTDYLKENL
jgi:hypothetical protein